MGIKSVDAGMLKAAVLASAKRLESKKEWINELNVFPVPDGDTGTNMTMTIMSAAREVGALEQINIVRARVGLGKIEEMNPELNLTANKDNLIKEILRERACELGWEYETRFHDMNRRLLIDDFKKHLHGIRIWRLDDAGNRMEAEDADGNDIDTSWDRDSGEPFPTKFEYEVYDINGETAYPRFVWDHPENWSNKWILSPLPPSEINKNYGLTQNPGWY